MKKIHAGAVGGCLLWACVGDSTTNTNDGGSDAAPDAVAFDSPVDSPAQEAAVDAGTIYNDMTNAANWETFDLTTNVTAGAMKFEGVVFDGRYMNFVPYGAAPNALSGVTVQYDTHAPFKTASSWTPFDLAQQVSTTLKGFLGGAYDGRYVYYVPWNNAPGTTDGVVARYDSLGPFANANSWSSFNVATVNAGATGFLSAIFDGQYLYLMPYFNGVNDGIVTRYDTQSAFTQGASWTTFDTTTVAAAAKGFGPGAFDGQYIYMVPTLSNGGSTFLKHDTHQAFNAGWTAFDVTPVNASAKGFTGACFDGRYLYFAPSNNGAPDGLVLRHDTTKTFNQAPSWTTFDLTTVNANAKAFQGTTFDGRYVYFVPAQSGVIARLDTTASFGSSTAWQTFDIASVNGGATGFDGAAFDGQYVYLAPYDGTTGGTVARFNAKSPPSISPKPQGSFF